MWAKSFPDLTSLEKRMWPKFHKILTSLNISLEGAAHILFGLELRHDQIRQTFIALGCSKKAMLGVDRADPLSSNVTPQSSLLICCCFSVTKLCLTLCDPMGYSTPSIPVLHHLQACSNSCPLDCKEMKSVNPKGNQPWIFTGRTDNTVKTPILWPADAKSQLIGKYSDSGKGWRQKEKRVAEEEMIR